jgi:glycosyltransferase involved in cell wall biosynthesis
MNKQTIEVSVVIPCLNEEEAIGDCIEKVKKVFLNENIRGEIIVVDNGSTDRSVDIAKNLGAKVIYQHLRGYGAAYIKGLKEAKGKYIIIGDGDGSYDFNSIVTFLEWLRRGYDLVMGSRFKGRIRKGAMPFLNRYVGNPILSGMCRLFFHTKLSDVHCGMRGFTKSSYRKMNLKCLGMEFATEMVMEALQRK